MLAMSQFTHSIVLFTGDDGLPIEFNIQNCTDKKDLSEMIEYGGGLCTHTNNAIHLVAPGTKVLNINTSKKIISSRYIYDCVRENYLLEPDDYKIEINEEETSDLSEDNTLNAAVDKLEDQRKSDDTDNSDDIIEPNKIVSPPLLNLPGSNHAFDFEDTESRNVRISEKTSSVMQQKPSEISAFNITLETQEKGPDNCVNVAPDSVDELDLSGNIEMMDHIPAAESNFPSVNNIQEKCVRDDSINAVIVSSSQPNDPVLDDFDNNILNKLKEKPTEEDDESQSYTVSSSADAQVSPKHSPRNTSAEIFSASSGIPDSASQTRDRQQYINNLEKEIKEILKKPSPKSIQDKIILVKYICCVKRLAPAIVLQTLQNF